jgi:hypothetical protein
VFQNACLVDELAARIPIYTHQRIPPNDGGLALGQACVARASRPAHPPVTQASEPARLSSPAETPRGPQGPCGTGTICA